MKSRISRIVFAGALLALASAASAEQWPCFRDLNKFCKNVKPGEGRIEQCLWGHLTELSPECYNNYKPWVRYLEACKPDIQKYCAATPGWPFVKDCLDQNASKISAHCAIGRPMRRQYQARPKPSPVPALAPSGPAKAPSSAKTPLNH